MLGPGMIRAVNAAGTVQDLIDREPDLLWDAVEIADEKAYEAGWTQDEEGRWFDEYGDETDSPLDMLYQFNLPDSLQDAIVDAVVECFNNDHRVDITGEALDALAEGLTEEDE